MKFNENLRQIRKYSGKTQKDIYTLLQVSPNCYASWEQGRTQPDIDNIKNLCRIFDVSADYLLGLDYYSDNTKSEKFEVEYKQRYTYMQGKKNYEKTKK